MLKDEEVDRQPSELKDAKKCKVQCRSGQRLSTPASLRQCLKARAISRRKSIDLDVLLPPIPGMLVSCRVLRG